MVVIVELRYQGRSQRIYNSVDEEYRKVSRRRSSLVAHVATDLPDGRKDVDIWASEQEAAAFVRLLRRATRFSPNVSLDVQTTIADQAVVPGLIEEAREVKPVPEWLTSEVISALVSAGEKALPSMDVPAAAAVIYRDAIITGWNDMGASGSASGHADINAVTNAIAYFGGPEAFKKLDRKHLFFVTTYEPCPMCEAAIAVEHRILPEQTAVLMLKEPRFRDEERELCRAFRSGWNYVGLDHIQQQLFCMHPGYRNAFPERCSD